MKPNLEKLENLLQLASTNFRTLRFDSKFKGTYAVTLSVANYSDSVFIAADIIKLCIMALQAEEPYPYVLGVNPRINFANYKEKKNASLFR